jgi:hypothetical protein
MRVDQALNNTLVVHTRTPSDCKNTHLHNLSIPSLSIQP